MNPPYAGGSHERFLYKALQISKNTISIEPDSFLFKGKQGNVKIKEILNNGYTEIEIIDANKYFDAMFQNRIVILLHNEDKENKILFNGQEIDDLYSIDFRQGDKYILEFKDIVSELYKNNNCGNKWKGVPGSRYPERYVKNEDEEAWVVQCVLLRGNIDPRQLNGKANDFYTLITSNNNLIEKQFIGKYKSLISVKDNKGKTKLQYYFKFNSEQEAKNFINYIKTDFARTCLYLKKNDMNVRWEYIPWFDFTDEHFSKTPREIDDWLFKKYDISDDIRKHIEEILPDYYGIRK